MSLVTNGAIYPAFAAEQKYTAEAQECIASTVSNLLALATTSEKPGMLLGKVQSGKTKTFLGVIALAFDNGFDVAVVFTKGTKALAQQTLSRISGDFSEAVALDLVHVFDVMFLPDPLAEYELNHKLVIVCKKEDDNIRRLENAIFNVNRDLMNKRFLIIDDEADFASIGFRRTKAEGIKINKIAQQIDDLRRKLPHCSVLQVTATPYSLYLQPDDLVIPATQQTFLPVKPAFTSLVPTHSKYIGGDYYFVESRDDGSIASYLHVPIRPSELDVLKKEDRRRFRIEDCLTDDAIAGMRRAIITFVIGGYIRRWQAEQVGEHPQKYSFIVHTETGREPHRWQEQLVSELIARLRRANEVGDPVARRLVAEAHADLARSVAIFGDRVPTVDQVMTDLENSLSMVNWTRVNSEKDVLAMLDDSGQLKLRTPFNIFIGGQILDRGLTIANLIGFFYGRSPNRFQQDTVLQHSRMYGVRPRSDLSVTRFYTTPDIYSAMHTIHEFDSALRREFETHGNDAEIIFLRADPQGRVIPCHPNKILLSTVTTLTAGARKIPKGFSTDAKSRALPHVEAIDNLVHLKARGEFPEPFLVGIDVAVRILDHIERSLRPEEDGEVDFDMMRTTLQHLASANPDVSARGQVACLVRRDREMKKFRERGGIKEYQAAPEGAGDNEAVAELRQRFPVMLLYRQRGRAVDGWSDCPFWLPVILAPMNTRTVIFASDTVD